MKLCFFTSGSVLYGANLSMVDLIIGLRGQVVESMVVYPEDGPLGAHLEKLGIKGVRSPFKDCVQWRSEKPKWHPRRWVSMGANAVRAVYKAGFNHSRVGALSEICRQFGADAVVTNSVAANIGLLVAERLGLPHIWHVREFGDIDWDFYPDFGCRARRRQMERSARVVFISRAVARHHLTQCKLAEAPKFRVIYNGIGSEEELERRGRVGSVSEAAVGQRPFVFGIAGFVKHSKGQFDAVSALKLAVGRGLDARLLVAGQGATDELRRHAERLGIADRVEILGHVRNEEMESFYRRIDCGLMCSTSEGFGRTTVEYMSYGKPVIGRDSGATPEILETNLMGILCGRSTDSLAGAMLQLATQENRLSEMGSAAKRIVRIRFSLEQAGAQFKELLDQLLQQKLDCRISR